jgi:hypothetical protein
VPSLAPLVVYLAFGILRARFLLRRESKSPGIDGGFCTQTNKYIEFPNTLLLVELCITHFFPGVTVGGCTGLGFRLSFSPPLKLRFGNISRMVPPRGSQIFTRKIAPFFCALRFRGRFGLGLFFFSN